MEEQQASFYEWNEQGSASAVSPSFELFDETLRDGLQSPSVIDPSIEHKIDIIHLMAELGIASADIGLPAAGPRAFADVLCVVQEIADCRLPIKPAAAARTTVADIQPIAEISQRVGMPLEVYAFIGSSPIRLFAENWSVDTLLKHVAAAAEFSLREGLPFCLVTEDTTRSQPEALEALFRAAIEMGVQRLCICDTVGYATPNGLTTLFAWLRRFLSEHGAGDVKVDWHGHNDRGLAVANALCALEMGADRVHGTALGIGERVGNASIDQILVNLKLMGLWSHDLSRLLAYCQRVSEACGVPVPYNYPVVGQDAFRTGTGVHAAAIIKAQHKRDEYLADRVYSAVPAGLFGRRQEIEIGPMSGKSNVHFWLQNRGIDFNDMLADAILRKAKQADHVLEEHEVLGILRGFENPSNRSETVENKASARQ